MKKFIVNVEAVEYGWVEVEAENEDEARELALEAEAEGMINWGNSEICVCSVEKEEE